MRSLEKMVNLQVVSSYLKPNCLKEFLESAREHGYLDNNHVLITDDDPEHSAKPVWEEMVHPNLFYIGAKARAGISKNKNRGIQFFLKNPKYETISLYDDDLTFVAPGLIEACINTRLPHLTGYLGSYVEGLGPDPDERKQFSGNPFFTDFPRQASSETGDVIYCSGSQGIMMYMTKAMVEKAMYFHVPPGHYGYEHSIYSNVINKCQGLYIDSFPILYLTPKYLIGNFNYPNQYTAMPEQNSKWWMEKKEEVRRGINFINKVSQVPEGEQVCQHST